MMIQTPDSLRVVINVHYPPFNSQIFEEFFYSKYIQNTVVTERIYLPIFWTSLYVNRNYGNGDLSDIQSFIDNSKNILKFCILKKISPYYIALSPWVEKLELKEEIYKISNSETILEILSETDKKLHRKYFNKEYNSKLN